MHCPDEIAQVLCAFTGRICVKKFVFVVVGFHYPHCIYAFISLLKYLMIYLENK